MKSILEAISKGDPNKTAVIDVNGSYTYKYYLNHIISLSEYFKNIGVKYGDNVIIVSKQTELFLAAFHAIQYIGAIPIPLEKNTKIDVINETKQLTEAVAVISAKEEQGGILYSELESINAESLEFNPTLNNVAEILFTTGTSGKSKGVILSHKADVAVSENIIYGVNKKYDDIELLPMPLNHSSALRRYFSNMYIGSTAVLCDGIINMKNFYNFIEECKCNCIAMNPTALDIICKLSKDKLSEYKNQLRYVQLGSAHLSEEGKEKLKKLLPESHLYNMYGSTEAGCTCVLDFSVYVNMTSCIGSPTVHSRFAVVDENEEIFNSDKDNMGRLICSGEMCMEGYYKDEETTKSVMKNGYVYSNDLSYIDEKGMVYVFGRCDDVIVCSGNKISPEEVEDAAKLSGLLEDCACVAYKDEKIGTVPKLICVPKAEYSEKALTKFLTEKLEYYMIPKKYEIRDSIPKSFNGKPLRRKLR